MTKKQLIKRYNQLMIDVETNSYYTDIDLTNRVNCYVCGCGNVIKTKDIDAGCTPFMILCDKCNEFAKSTFYKDIKPNIEPQYEWYRPTLEEILKLRKKEPELIEHILRGGLDYRKIKK